MGALGVGCVAIEGPIYVSTTGSDVTGDGSEGNPYATIQHGINQASGSDTILVAPGTYVENIWMGAMNFTIGSYFLTTGDENYIDQTVIDGGGVDCVVSFLGETSSARLSGFTITNGLGADSEVPESRRGGGISCMSQASPSLEWLKLIDNESPASGGAFYCYNCSPTLNRITCTGNTAESGSVLDGIYANLVCDSLLAYDNPGAYGINLYEGFGVYLSNLTLVNSGTAYGMVVWGSLSLNHATLYGSGTGLYMDCAEVNLSNCIVWHPTPVEIGSECADDVLTVDYSNLQGGQGAIQGQAYATINWLDGNIDADPLFCDTLNDDFTLYNNSPCVGTGDGGSDIGAHGVGCSAQIGLIYVSTSGSDVTGDGSEGNPYATIQHGINQASGSDTVLVEDGLYIETFNFEGKNITVASRFLLDGNENHIDDTVINGAGAGCVATFANGETSAARLAGLTLTNGYGPTSPEPEDCRGGGISCVSDSSPILEHLVLTGNFSAQYGGGIYCCSSSPTLNSIIINNNDAGDGGGLACLYAHPDISDLEIYNNGDTYQILLEFSDPVVTYTTVYSDVRTSSAILCYNSGPQLDHLTIRGTATGITCLDASYPVLNSSILWDNITEIEFMTEGAPCAINIIYSDLQGGESAVETNGNGMVDWGAGNINNDPRFCDPAAGDLTLAQNSPCAGTAEGGTDMGALEVGCDAIVGMLYVSTAGSDTTGNGSEGNPYATVQHGILQAAAGDTVVAEDGVYTENIDFLGKDITVGSRYMIDGISGHMYNTVISGGDSTSCVRFVNGESGDARLIGLALMDGHGRAAGLPADVTGGAVTCSYGSSPYLERLYIMGNEADSYGGGIYLHGSSPTLNNIQIYNNQAQLGGGMTCVQSHPSLINIDLTVNNSVDGAQILLIDSDPICSLLTIRNSDRGFVCESSDPVIDHSTLSGLEYGILCSDASQPQLSNSILWDNQHEVCFDPNGSANHITITWSDVQLGETGIETNGNGTYDWDGTNITLDPLFCEPGSDYQLADNSPCLGSGEGGSNMGAWGQGYCGDLHRYWWVATTGSDVTGEGTEINPLATIQAGIDQAQAGDTVLVEEGSYAENIDLNGKRITVASRYWLDNDPAHIEQTIINPDLEGSAVTFAGGETDSTLFCGFTLIGGHGLGAPEFENCTGGGVTIKGGAYPTLSNLYLIDNYAESYGGGIYCWASSPTLIDIALQENSSSVQGCAVAFIAGDPQWMGGSVISYGFYSQIYLKESDAGLAQLLIYGSGTSGIYCEAAEPQIANCTLTDLDQGLYCTEGSYPQLSSMLIWDNLQQVVFDAAGAENQISVAYSDIFGGEEGIETNGNGTVDWLEGNIFANPLFCDPENDDYTLADNSPCLTAGENSTDMGALGAGDCGSVYSYIYVSTETGSDTWGDGSQEDPYATVQRGIEAAIPGDAVVVEDGVYYESIDFLGKNITVASHYLLDVDSTHITGTVIDADGENRVAIFAQGESWVARLAALTLQGGCADHGGAILCDGASPTLEWLVIQDNFATGNGGAICCLNSAVPELTQLYLQGNQAEGDGGAVYLDDSDPVLTELILTGNSAGGSGGGIFCNDGSDPVLTAVEISDNSAGLDGGGIAVQGQLPRRNGGGNDQHERTLSAPQLTEITLVRNSAGGDGGGLWSGAEGQPLLENCVVVDNLAAGLGGAFYNSDASILVILRATVAGNVAASGGGLACAGGDVGITNSILWNYSPVEIEQSGGTITATWCDIRYGWTGDNIISYNPLFCAPDVGDYTLAANSPCLGAGEGGTDLGSLPEGCEARTTIYFVSPDGDDETGDGSEADPFATVQHGIDMSSSGDTVIVEEGEYIENLLIVGKEIHLGSRFLLDGNWDHVDNTILNGGGGQLRSDSASVISFLPGGHPLAAPWVAGFTITNGTGWLLTEEIGDDVVTRRVGGGLFIREMQTNFKGNKIQDNDDDDPAGGIDEGGAGWCFGGIPNFGGPNGPGGFNPGRNTFRDNYAAIGKTFHMVIAEGAEVIVHMDSCDFDVYNFDEEAISPYWASSSLGDVFTFVGGTGADSALAHDVWVAPDGDDDNSGWADSPFRHIDYALSRIWGEEANPVTIHAASGVYSASTTEETLPLQLLDWVSLEGAGSAGTILDGEGLTGIVLFSNSFGCNCGGLTLTGGVAGCGGAIYCRNSSPHLYDLRLTQNSAVTGGGLALLAGSEPLLEQVVIHENSAALGGGIFLSESGVIFEPVDPRCSVYLNEADFGSDLYSDGLVPVAVVVDSFTVINPSDYYTHPLSAYTFDIYHGALPDLYNGTLHVNPEGDDGNSGTAPETPLRTIGYALSRIWGDTGHPNLIELAAGTYSPGTSGELFPIRLISHISLQGAGVVETILHAGNPDPPEPVIMADRNLDLTLERLTISGGSDGGMRCRLESELSLTELLITGNAGFVGGGVYNSGSQLICDRLTLTGNSADEAGGAIYSAGEAVLEVINSIILANSLPEVYLKSGTGEITYSDVGGGWDGEGNLDCDPRFCNPAAGEYTLAANSVCLGSGEGGVDMGAFGEGCDAITRSWYVTTTGSDGEGDGSEGSPFATVQYAIDRASHQDTVLVEAGIYVENINFNGRNVVVGSHYLLDGDWDWIDETFLTSNQSGTVVTFTAGETTAELCGFTITGGLDENGGGVYCDNGAAPILRNLVLCNNTALERGGAVYVQDTASPTLLHVTVYGNLAVESGGGLYCADESRAVAVNSIFWGNSSPGGADEIGGEEDVVWAFYSDIAGGWPGEGNLDADPLFTDPEACDLWPQPDSPCLEAGVQDTWFLCAPGDTIWVPPYTFLNQAPDLGALEVELQKLSDQPQLPQRFALHQNYPNPFNPTTTIRYDLPRSVHVKLELYNLLGQRVALLLDERVEAGYRQVIWDGRNAAGNQVASGLYFYRLRAGNYTKTRKMMLLR